MADSDSSALTTTLSVDDGILNATAGAGVTGNGTATVIITGTAAQINAALVGLAYTGNPDFSLCLVSGVGLPHNREALLRLRGRNHDPGVALRVVTRPGGFDRPTGA